MIIRHARRDEYGAIAALIEEALRDSAVSLGHEVQLVALLRSSAAHIPGLEYVAADDDSGEILGHIILSVLPISHGNSSIRGLLLAPLSVRPAFQHQGIGTALVERSIADAVSQGYRGIFLVGDPDYYSRFGFVPAVSAGIRNRSVYPDEYVLFRPLDESLSADLMDGSPYSVVLPG